MNKIVRWSCICAVLLAFVGCSWEAYEEGEAWTDTGFSWVNFSGVYRPSSGGIIVANYDATPGTAPSTNSVPDETLFYASSSNTTYGSPPALRNVPIVPGSITIIVGGFSFRDDDADSVLEGNAGGADGTIDYGTGAWSIDLKGQVVADGERARAGYQYVIGGTAGSIEPGNSGDPIYSFIIQQTGNQLVFIDSTGDRYEGVFVSMSSTSGAQMPLSGSVMAEFLVYGVGDRDNVAIQGLLMGSYRVDTILPPDIAYRESLQQELEIQKNAIFENRTISATWLEDGSSGTIAGDIKGVADDVEVATP